MSQPPRFTVPLLAFMLTATSTAADPAPATAVEVVGPSCLGEPATLVGSPELRTLNGTPSDDVIVTAGAGAVNARSGDDLVCVTGRTRRMDAGAGADRVTSSDSDPLVFVDLGAGNDSFTGGDRPDYVYTGEGSDQVDTGEGDDQYSSAAFDTDVATLGPGNDLAVVSGSNGPDTLDGGPGHNVLAPEICCDVSHDWEFDNVTEVGIVDGEPTFHWDNFRQFTFGAWSVEGSVVFRGSDASEHVRASQELEYGPNIEQIDMRGGNDQVTLNGLVGPASGGPGDDWVRVVGFADERSPSSLARRLRVDLAEGRLVLDDGSVRTVSIPGFENVEVSDFVTAVVGGDDQPNRIVVGRACLARVHAAGGTDILQARAGENCAKLLAGFFEVPRSIRADGGAGTDLLQGRGTPDRLLGGPGFDAVDGREGDDTCQAEISANCERRPSPARPRGGRG